MLRFFILWIGHKGAAPACFWRWVAEMCDLRSLHSKRSVFFSFSCHWLLSQPKAAKADLRSVLNPDLSAAFAPTLPQCGAANTSALLLGRWPTNPLTPWKHKQIDTLRREPDNPSFHLHSRLSSITGILSPVSSLVARKTNRGLGNLLSS